METKTIVCLNHIHDIIIGLIELAKRTESGADRLLKLQQQLEMQKLVATELASELGCVRIERTAIQEEFQKEIFVLQGQVGSIEHANKTLTISITELQEMVAGRDQIILSLEKQRSANQVALQSMVSNMKSEHSEELSKLQDMTKKLQKDKQDLIVKASKNDDRNMAVVVAELELLQDAVKELLDVLSAKNSAITNADIQITTLENSISEKAGIIGDLKKLLSDKDSQMVKLETSVSETAGKINDLKKANFDKDSEIVTLENLVSEKAAIIVDMKKSLADKDLQIATLENSALEKAESISELEMSATKNVTINELQNYVTEKDSQIAILENSVADLTSKASHGANINLELVEAEFELLRDTIQELLATLSEKSMAVNTAENTIVDLEGQLDQMRKTVEKYDSYLIELEQGAIHLHADVTKKTQQYSDERKKLEKQLAERNKKIQKMSRDLKKSKDRVQQQSKQIVALQNSERKLKDRINYISDELGESNRERQNTETKNAKLLRSFHAESVKKDTIIESLKETLARLQSELPMSTRHRGNRRFDSDHGLKTDIAKLKTAIADKERAIEVLQTEITDNNWTIAGYETDINYKDTIIDRQATELKTKTSIINQLDANATGLSLEL